MHISRKIKRYLFMRFSSTDVWTRVDKSKSIAGRCARPISPFIPFIYLTIWDSHSTLPSTLPKTLKVKDILTKTSGKLSGKRRVFSQSHNKAATYKGQTRYEIDTVGYSK
jgi:hypothetical protein